MKLKKIFISIYNSHKFFIEESKTFVGIKSSNLVWIFKYIPWKKSMIGTLKYENLYYYQFKDLLYYPIAYLNFMYLMIYDIILYTNNENNK